MRDKETIDREIEALKEEAQRTIGRNCEVYQRITGYYRALHNWGIGKVEEYHHRKVFSLPSFIGGSE